MIEVLSARGEGCSINTVPNNSTFVIPGKIFNQFIGLTSGNKLTIQTPADPGLILNTLTELKIVFTTGVNNLSWTAAAGAPLDGANMPTSANKGDLITLVWVKGLSSWYHVVLK